MYERGDGENPSHLRKAFNYLLDLEREGLIDGGVLDKIGTCYKRGDGHAYDAYQAVNYYQRAINVGYSQAFLGLFSSFREYEIENRIAPVLEAWENGVGLVDDRVLLRMPNEHEVGVFLAKTRITWCNPRRYIYNGSLNYHQLQLHYCDILIERKSHLGYRNLGEEILRGTGEMRTRWTRAVSIWEEGDRVGLCDFPTYNEGLQRAYR